MVVKNMVAFTHFHSVPENGCPDRFETFWIGLDRIAQVLGINAY
jgi:hypothetical protein